MNAPINRDEVLALLEDGPKRSAELAKWLACPIWKMQDALARLAAEGIIARHGASHSTRWSLPPAPTASSAERQTVPPRVVQASRLSRSDSSEEFEVVWNGIGPLPGSQDTPAGLGSTLSAPAFHVGKATR